MLSERVAENLMNDKKGGLYFQMCNDEYMDQHSES